MRSVIRFGMLLAVMGLLVPELAEACNRCKKESRWCNFCRKTQTLCNCVAPPAPVTTWQPVVETHYRQEQYVNQKTVVETHYRSECFTKTVPMTCYETITVDEGCWQQIWVPKLVCKQVPKTVYTQQMGTRPVPYQVTKTIPEICTRAVPYQTMRYLPNTDPCPPVASPISTYPLPPQNYAAPVDPAAAPQVPPAGAQAIPQGTRYATPAGASNLAPMPDPQFLHAPVQQPAPGPQLQTPTTHYAPPHAHPHTPHQMAAERMDAYELDVANPMLNGIEPMPGPAPTISPAPSAAQVWRTPRGTITR